MRLSVLDTTLWAAGPSMDAALLYVLAHRRRLAHFRMLAIWTILTIVSNLIGFWAFHFATHETYSRVYWASEAIDALMQLGVILEVASIVFRPVRFRASGQRAALLACAVAIVLVSLGISVAVHPTSPTRTGILEIQGQIFTSLLVCIVFTLVLFSSQRLGLYWRSHVMSVGYGLTVWSVVCLALDLLHGYWGRSSHFLELEHIRMVAYLGIFAFWSFALWREEPKRKPVTPEMQASLLHISEKVSYDLAKALGTRGKEFH